MKTTLNPILRTLLLPALALLASCSDWTDPESLGLRTPTVEEQNPEAYAAYLANLRSWKASAHQVVLAEFDHSVAEPTSQAHHIAALPDSLDVVVLGPSPLPVWQQAELEETRRDKGTRFVCTVDFAQFRADWEQQLTQTDDAADADTDTDWLAYLAACTDAALDACTRGGFDGVVVRYSGKSILHMTDDERAAYAAEQNAFLDPVRAWIERNGSKLFLFGGDPTTVLDPQLLLAADWIVADTSEATSVDELTFVVRSCLGAQIPSDRFVVAVPTVVRNDPHAVGYYGQQMALPLAAEWVTRPSADFVRAGLLIEGVERDFYHADLIYKYTREAIATITPSPKNR